MSEIETTERLVIDFDTMDRDELVSVTNYALRVLAPRQVLVVCVHRGLNTKAMYTLAEIGLVMGITKQRVQQIEAAALGKLDPLRLKVLEALEWEWARLRGSWRND